jgi:hypothetical protein
MKKVVIFLCMISLIIVALEARGRGRHRVGRHTVVVTRVNPYPYYYPFVAGGLLVGSYALSKNSDAYAEIERLVDCVQADLKELYRASSEIKSDNERLNNRLNRLEDLMMKRD